MRRSTVSRQHHATPRPPAVSSCEHPLQPGPVQQVEGAPVRAAQDDACRRAPGRCGAPTGGWPPRCSTGAAPRAGRRRAAGRRPAARRAAATGRRRGRRRAGRRSRRIVASSLPARRRGCGRRRGRRVAVMRHLLARHRAAHRLQRRPGTIAIPWDAPLRSRDGPRSPGRPFRRRWQHGGRGSPSAGRRGRRLDPHRAAVGAGGRGLRRRRGGVGRGRRAGGRRRRARISWSST